MGQTVIKIPGPELGKERKGLPALNRHRQVSREKSEGGGIAAKAYHHILLKALGEFPTTTGQ